MTDKKINMKNNEEYWFFITIDSWVIVMCKEFYWITPSKQNLKCLILKVSSFKTSLNVLLIIVSKFKITSVTLLVYE